MASSLKNYTLAAAFGIGLFYVGVQPAQAQVSNASFELNGGSFLGWGTAGDTLIQTSSLGTGPTDGTHDALLASATDGTVNTGVPAGSGVGSAALESLLQINVGSLNLVGNGSVVKGSAISQTVNLAAGQILTFDWDFITNQVFNDGVTAESYAPDANNNDFAFFSIAPSGHSAQGAVTKLADTFDGFVADGGAPGGFKTAFVPTSASNPFISETLFHTFSFTATAAGSYVIGAGAVHVTKTPDDGINSAVLVDNFRVSSVPEPASMIGIGALCMGLLRRRRGKATS